MDWDAGLPRVHWFSPGSSSDPFLEGVRAGLHWSLSLAFGGVIGGLLEQMTLTQVQFHDGVAWRDVA